MMTRRLRHIAIALSATLLFVACNREPLPVSPVQEPAGSVRVPLSLQVAPTVMANPGTRALDIPDNELSTHICNLCILQFNGSSTDSELVGDVHYLTEEADPSDRDAFLDLDRIRLVDSGGEKHTVVILANTFTRLPRFATLGDLLDAYHSIYEEADLFGKNTDGSSSTTLYQRLNGIAVTEIAEGNPIPVILRRSMARISVHISNSGADGLVVRDVRLCNVPKPDFYLTDYSYPVPEDNSTGFIGNGVFAPPYNPNDPMRKNYLAEPWNGESDGTGDGTYRWFIPANLRGTDESVATADDKNHSPNADGATYLQVRCNSGTDERDIFYRFYLGQNLINDFNLRPNTSYSFDIRLDGKGRISEDERIQSYHDIDFDVDANCYMLHPSSSGPRTYTFNVIHRPNLFWGDRYGLRDDYPNYYIDRTKRWKAQVLWSDFEMTAEQVNAFLVRKEGNGDGDYMSDNQRVKVVVPAGMAGGNVVIGIYIDDPSNIIWSWHLWITDYMPDEIDGHAPKEGAFIYPVTNGQVHRYGGPAWQPGGLYERGYAMDRNLGAIDVRTHTNEKGGGLMYCFGQKDPYGGKHPVWRYDENGVATKRNAGGYHQVGNADLLYYKGDTEALVPYTVNHPMTLIYQSNGAAISQFNPINNTYSIIWQDPKNTERTDHEEGGENADKSLFDPCPPGWRVPEMRSGNPQKNCYAGIVTANKQNTNLDAVNTVYDYSDPTQLGYGRGWLYYPGGYLAGRNDPSAPFIFFQSIDYRYNGFFQTGAIRMILISASRSNYSNFYVFTDYWYSGSSAPSLFQSFYGFETGNIRCVRQ